MLLALGLAPSFVAAAARPSHPQSVNRHSRQGAKAKPGVPNSRVRKYKVDDEVSRRSKRNPQGTTSVIVTFVQGGEVPPQLRKYMRGLKLDIINGQVLAVDGGFDATGIGLNDLAVRRGA